MLVAEYSFLAAITQVLKTMSSPNQPPLYELSETSGEGDFNEMSPALG